MSIFRLFTSDPGEPTLLDHVHVAPDEEAAKRHAVKLAEAARRYGKPFKCSVDGLPREVVKDHTVVTVGANVTKLPARKTR